MLNDITVYFTVSKLLIHVKRFGSMPEEMTLQMLGLSLTHSSRNQTPIKCAVILVFIACQNSKYFCCDLIEICILEH